MLPTQAAAVARGAWLPRSPAWSTIQPVELRVRSAHPKPYGLRVCYQKESLMLSRKEQNKHHCALSLLLLPLPTTRRTKVTSSLFKQFLHSVATSSVSSRNHYLQSTRPTTETGLGFGDAETIKREAWKGLPWSRGTGTHTIRKKLERRQRQERCLAVTLQEGGLAGPQRGSLGGECPCPTTP